MKLLLISNMYPDNQHPGFGIFVKHTEDILVSEGFDVEKVVRYKKNKMFLKIIDYILFYLKILYKGFFHSYDGIYIHFAAHPSLPVLFLRIFKRKVKIITNVHGTDVVPENKIHVFFQIFVKKILKKSDVIIAPSIYFQDLVAKKYNISTKKIEVFPSGGIDKDIFYPVSNKKNIYKKFNLDPTLSYLGFVGRIEYGKGWETFLEAINILNRDKQLINKKVIFVGYGDQLDMFNEKVNTLGLNDKIIHYKYMQQHELNLIYNILDFFCFPTERKGESLGLVGIEAMACGTPVIGSKIAGLQSYISDYENGMLFKPKDAEDLISKIKEFYKLDQGEINTIKKNALITAKRYEKGNIKGRLIEIFRSISAIK